MKNMVIVHKNNNITKVRYLKTNKKTPRGYQIYIDLHLQRYVYATVNMKGKLLFKPAGIKSHTLRRSSLHA